MSIDISRAYGLLLQVVGRYRLPGYDVGEIAREARGSDAELGEDGRLFDENLAKLHDALSGGDDYALTEALLLLRGSATNISTIMSNLADEIEAVVIAERDRQA